MYYIGRDVVKYGLPMEGFGQEWIGTLASSIAALGAVGASIYGGVLQNKLAVDKYREERKRYNEDQRLQQQLLQLQQQQLDNAAASQSGVSNGVIKAPATIMTTERIGGIPTNYVLYGGIALGGVVLLVLLLRR